MSSHVRNPLRTLLLHEAEKTTDDAHAKEAEDDDDRRDLLLEEAAAEQRQAHRGEAGDELVEVLLEGYGLDLVKAGGAERGILRKRALDTIGIGSDLRPVDVGTRLLRDRGDDRRERDGHPALDERADDEHAEDRGAFGDLAEHATGEVLRDGHAGLVAKLLRVPEEGETDGVPEDEEQERADDGAAEGERGAEGTEDRSDGKPEDGVADAGERTHHADLDALDGLVIDGLAVGAPLLECEGDADDGGGDVGVRVVELEVTLEGGDLVVLVGIQLLDCRDHGVAPAAVLHSLVVPRALQVLVAYADCTTVGQGQRDPVGIQGFLSGLDFFCHC